MRDHGYGDLGDDDDDDEQAGICTGLLVGDGDPHGKHGNQGFEDDEEGGSMAREHPEYALINHHYTHIDDQRPDPRRLHHRHPSPFLDNLP